MKKIHASDSFCGASGTSEQLTLDSFFVFKKRECRHRLVIVTYAYVPAGMACMDCGALLAQYVPQSPEALGYLSADWAWHHVHGKDWTTK